MLKRLIFSHFVVASCLAAPLFAQESSHATPSTLAKVGESFRVEIDRAGFELASRSLKSEYFEGLSEKVLAPVDFSLPPLMAGRLSGLAVRADIDDFSIEPSSLGLDIHLTINNLVVDLEKIRFENYFFPGLATECFGTQLAFGKNEPIDAHASVALALAGERLSLKTRSFAFDLERSQYESKGPLQCVGPLGIDDRISRFVLSKALSHARHAIAGLVQAKMRSALPKLADMLNSKLSEPLPLDIPDLYLIPGMRLVFQMSPERLELSAQKLAIVLGMQVKREESADLGFDKSIQAGSPEFIRIASFGVNPELVNVLLALVLRDGTREVEIPADLHERLGQLLNVNDLAVFWPDLEMMKPSSEAVKLFASLRVAPKLILDPAKQGILLTLPHFATRFEVELDKTWTDYFTMHHAVKVEVLPHLDHGALALSLLNPKDHITGGWAPAYQPKDPFFDADSAGEIFNVFMTEAVRTASPFVFDLPTLYMGGEDVSFHNFHVDPPFIMVDFQQEVGATASGA